jgi:hypothetical protein
MALHFVFYEGWIAGFAHRMDEKKGALLMLPVNGYFCS